MTEPSRSNSRRTRKAMRENAVAGHLDIASDPAFATHHDDPLAEEIKVADIWKGRRRVNHIRVTLKRYEGRAICDVRQYFVTAEGRSQPTTRGIAISLDKLPDLAKALEKACQKALDLDLIEATS